VREISDELQRYEHSAGRKDDIRILAIGYDGVPEEQGVCRVSLPFPEGTNQHIIEAQYRPFQT
jgi:hypothetical protein